MDIVQIHSTLFYMFFYQLNLKATAFNKTSTDNIQIIWLFCFFPAARSREGQSQWYDGILEIFFSFFSRLGQSRLAVKLFSFKTFPRIHWSLTTIVSLHHPSSSYREWWTAWDHKTNHTIHILALPLCNLGQLISLYKPHFYSSMKWRFWLVGFMRLSG